MFRYNVKSVVSFGEIHVNYPFVITCFRLFLIRKVANQFDVWFAIILAQIASQIAMRIHINTPLTPCLTKFHCNVNIVQEKYKNMALNIIFWWIKNLTRILMKKVDNKRSFTRLSVEKLKAGFSFALLQSAERWLVVGPTRHPTADHVPFLTLLQFAV